MKNQNPNAKNFHGLSKGSTQGKKKDSATTVRWRRGKSFVGRKGRWSIIKGKKKKLVPGQEGGGQRRGKVGGRRAVPTKNRK